MARTRQPQRTTLEHASMIQDFVQASSVEDDTTTVTPEAFRQDEVPIVPAMLLQKEEQDDEVPIASDDHETNVVSARLVPDTTERSRRLPRPEFLYISAIKPTPDSSVGVRFKRKKTGVTIFISRITPGGIFDKSGLQVGDQLLAVNKVDCTRATLQEVQERIDAAESTVSLCVWNEGGDPHFVLSSVQKPIRNMKVGIFFLQRQGALVVTSIRENSLFANSLITPNHRCYFLNGEPCDNKVGQAAADLAASADRVTIISRARGDMATVLSVGSKRTGQRWPWKRESFKLHRHALEHQL